MKEQIMKLIIDNLSEILKKNEWSKLSLRTVTDTMHKKGVSEIVFGISIGIAGYAAACMTNKEKKVLGR